MSGQFRTITMFFMLPQYFLVDFSKVYNNGCIWWHKHGNFTIYDNVVHIYAYASGHTEDIFDLWKLNLCLLKSFMFSVKCIFMLLEMLSKVKKTIPPLMRFNDRRKVKKLSHPHQLQNRFFQGLIIGWFLQIVIRRKITVWNLRMDEIVRLLCCSIGVSRKAK